MNNFKVSIRCITFNHAPYIKDALDGFSMQQTSFPFVVIIVDDASTDGEPGVIQRYLHTYFDLDDKEVVRKEETDDYVLTFAQHKENINCFFAIYQLKYNFFSIKKSKATLFIRFDESAKYIGLCEGDDYWTCPDKLQQQVDFLETHSDYTMCFHDVNIKAEEGRERYDVFGQLEDRDYTGIENLFRWSVPTCSMIMRAQCFHSLPVNTKFTMGDNVTVLHCSRNGKIRCIPKKMGVYRLNPTSWIGGQSDKTQRYKYISHYHGLIEEFEECRCETVYNILEGQYFQLLVILKREKNMTEYEKIKNDYFNYPGTVHWWQYRMYFVKSQIRSFLKRILGKTIIQTYRRIRYQ